MTKRRPVNLNLFTIQFPLPAIISILHRVSGVFVYLLIPVFLWVLANLLTSPTTFQDVQSYLFNPVVKLGFWLFLSALSYHLMAGIRHLFMDMGIGETLKGGRLGAQIVLVLAVLVSISIGVWIW